MARSVKLNKFYTTDPWITFRFNLIVERGNKCCKCHKVFSSDKLIGHHIIELDDSNVDDYTISLNPLNIEIICLDCHNKEHKRFGYQPVQKVYIVYGSPLSGKTSLVNQLATPSDLIIDIDRIYSCLSICNLYDKSNAVKSNVFAVYDKLIDNVKTRYGRWECAYIVGGFPDILKRERLKEELNAELIYCESTKEECIKRFYQSNKPDEWLSYIDDWWNRFKIK